MKKYYLRFLISLFFVGVCFFCLTTDSFSSWTCYSANQTPSCGASSSTCGCSNYKYPDNTNSSCNQSVQLFNGPSLACPDNGPSGCVTGAGCYKCLPCNASCTYSSGKNDPDCPNTSNDWIISGITEKYDPSNPLNINGDLWVVDGGTLIIESGKTLSVKKVHLPPRLGTKNRVVLCPKSPECPGNGPRAQLITQ